MSTISRRVFILGLLCEPEHDKQHFRVGHELIPGRPWWDLWGSDMARNGHASALRALYDTFVAQGSWAAVSDCCTTKDADIAAANGHLEVIWLLREYDTHCTFVGADNAAENGHLAVIQDLRAHDIHCTFEGADAAAANGHLAVIQDLRAYGVHCSSYGVDRATSNGHSDVVRDLQAHTIECTSSWADKLGDPYGPRRYRATGSEPLHALSRSRS